ncbi:uncharacterized protein SETTUDRAFT_165432 [Exserohilum turcica Et28A]|uniref:Uncharacterized protein n=1 Tax=Exserohilum turcicum (strain 28A) TaxID=671987 RepID=R0K062_EXST2|nr:uncharacterized protein SETTUDRAFT_165432 [Exserohilum turcica Et28A]EOA81847.1 hypothetical protein SETTUDRAFT_165432 [Exserohilum turcica Et28A]
MMNATAFFNLSSNWHARSIYTHHSNETHEQSKRKSRTRCTMAEITENPRPYMHSTSLAPPRHASQQSPRSTREGGWD